MKKASSTTKKLLTGTAIAAVATLGLTACGAGDPSAGNDNITIGVTVYDRSAFITQAKEGNESNPRSPQRKPPGFPSSTSTPPCPART